MINSLTNLINHRQCLNVMQMHRLIRVITGCTCVKQLKMLCHISINFNALKYKKKASFYIYLYSKYQAKMSTGIAFNMYKTYLVSHSSKKKKKKLPTYLPISQMMGRSTANIHIFKDGLNKMAIRAKNRKTFKRHRL